MARLSKVWKMGQTSGSLEFIPGPNPNIDRSPLWSGAVHLSLGNNTTIDQLPSRRSWNLSWSHLIDADMTIMKKYWDGTFTWPFYLHDPRFDGGTFAVTFSAPPTTSIERFGRYALSFALREYVSP